MWDIEETFLGTSGTWVLFMRLRVTTWSIWTFVLNTRDITEQKGTKEKRRPPSTKSSIDNLSFFLFFFYLQNFQAFAQPDPVTAYAPQAIALAAASVRALPLANALPRA